MLRATLADLGVVLMLSAVLAAPGVSGAATAEEVEFFETRIRPVLAQDCYECHRTGGKTKGGLALDHRGALRAGGDTGPAVVPGDPERSLLITAIRHADEDLQMPKKGAKLEAGVIADFVKWVEMGAPDPRDAPAGEADVAADRDWAAVMRRRKGWWSFQPVTDPEVPQVDGHDRPVDRFVAAKIAAAGLTPAGGADKRTLIRRLSFALRGLPPAPEEVREFLADENDDAYERLVDHYLASPQFGERWARHWMDWLRYADSSGSEGDPMIPHAWRYRDYLIRALNADVPYDRLVREHVAGDLLEEKRVVDGIDESALGTAHLRMVFHGFAPTDALDEQVRFTDDEINVLTKGFMGLTVSCARCHDHKFDAISQADYYALYGIFASTTPGMVDVVARGADEERDRSEMEVLKKRIRARVGSAWMEAAKRLPESLKAVEEKAPRVDVAYLYQQAGDERSLGKAIGDWKGLVAELEEYRKRSHTYRWDLGRDEDFGEWAASGGSAAKRSAPGGFTVAREGDGVIGGLYPSGVYSHLLTDKDRGVLFSPRMQLDGAYEVWVLTAGDGEAMVRPVVQNYPRSGTVYPTNTVKDGKWRWVKFGLDYWEGDLVRIEVTTAADQPVLAKTNVERSWFGVREAILVKKGEPQPPQVRPEFIEAVMEVVARGGIADRAGVARAYVTATKQAVQAWLSDTMSDGQAALLAALLERKVLPNEAGEIPGVEPLLASYRELEGRLPVPVRAPGVWETPDPFDQPLFVRGDHKQPSEEVPRRFLEAIDAKPYETDHSGRRQLAEDMLRPDNPFTARVIVNRIWHHLFGRGLVATTDNFGRLGEQPSHPGLLDHLAVRMRQGGWSMKGLIRDLVLSETWQRSSVPPAGSAEKDPGNILLSHFRVRRLEAEAIRDSLLAVTGRLEDGMYGPPITGGAPRRSVYMRIKRNDLDPFLAAFDAPVPASTKGRRDVTNVPAQSLAMLNSGFVIGLAESFATRMAAEDDAARAGRMFEAALGRPASVDERDEALAFVKRMAGKRQATQGARKRLEDELAAVGAKLGAIADAGRKRVEAKRGAKSEGPAGPKPVAWWEFEGDAGDALGGLDLELHGGARIADGVLVVGERNGYASSAPLKNGLEAKTLEAWVQLDNLGQRGGGVMTVQGLDGGQFDAIVFAERDPRQWLAGSNHFARTKSFGAPQETAAQGRPVHVAIVWGADGTITGYREGRPYGAPYRSDGPVAFRKGGSQVLFGNRHGSPGANRLLHGKIFEARLYDRALSAGEVAASAGRSGEFVTEEDLEAALTPAERKARGDLREQEEKLRRDLEATPASSQPGNEWADLAHALFNLKEFTYVR